LVKLIKRKLSRTHYIVTCFFVLLQLAVRAQYNNIEFVENKGQWDNRVKFQGDVGSGAFFVRSAGFTVVQHNPADLKDISDAIHGFDGKGNKRDLSQKLTLRSHAYSVDFVGASTQPSLIPDKPLDTYNNYFIGSDPSKWAGNCKIYQGITIKDVYPGVDVRYYTGNGILKYDIIANPGSDISKIALKYDGADKLEIRNRELNIGTSVGTMKELAPYTYQFDGKEKKELSCKYVLKDNIVRFDVKDYDPNSTVIIDPSLVFCTFSGSTADNWGFTATYGPDGSMYGGGIVFGTGFPVTSGAYQTVFGGGGTSEPSNGPIDIGLIKLSPNGSSRIYATYIGGGGNELPASLIVDAQGELIMAGRTDSPNYPVTDTAGRSSNWDIIITKFNAAGTALIGSRKIGGTGMDGANISAGSAGLNSLNRNYGDEARSEVNLDNAGNIYVASCTQSHDFRVTNNAFQQTFGGGLQDGVLLKFNPNLSTLLFSSYLGGSGNDAAYVLVVAPSGDIYVAGGTEEGSGNNAATDFPGSHAGTVSTSHNGLIDGFIAQISNNGSSIIRSTYIGTPGNDQVYGIQLDNNGFVYVTGQTTGAWPIVNAVYNNPSGKQFIEKIKPDLSGIVYSTAFGSGTAIPNISPTAFLVDRCENVYVSGWGGGENWTRYPTGGTLGLPVTADAIQPTTDGSDFYFFVLKRDATAQLYGSFFGQQGGSVITDHVDGGTSRFDRNGTIYQGICANCEGGFFPTTPGSWSPNNPSRSGAQCNLALLKIAFNLAGVATQVQASINGVPRDTSGCVPLTVDFSDSIRNAVSYEWNFGDGSPVVATTSPTISHTYSAVGFYTVMLIGIDPNSCNIRDTSYTHIRVGDIQATLAFNPVKLAPCDSFKYQFNNTSLAPPVRPFGANSFIWDFGDGSPRVSAGLASIIHNYSGPGTYTVKLVLQDTNYCNAPDSISVQLRVAALVKANFTTPPVGCAPYTAIFDNTSDAGQSFEWDFGDGGTSTATSPTHLYSVPGTYTITLVANDPNTCNLTDTFRFIINVYDKPVADFIYAPNPPIENTPTIFTNLSSANSIKFKWTFGDGDSLITTSMAAVQHQYNATGTFNACLVAFNAAGCTDTVCKQVQAIVNPLVDVPNAFTPLTGGTNSIVMVRGFGIAKMRFTIWNRWGQKVFETENRLEGWDGKYKGVIQPMDVYAYTLSVEFFDGTKATKKGDITLIR
jgi:gliding motility-associated-like protein